MACFISRNAKNTIGTVEVKSVEFHSEIPKLNDLQSQFWQAILHPLKVQQSDQLGELSTLVDLEGFLVYQDTVQSAHVNALRMSYPKTATLLGEAVFMGLARGYFLHFPPIEPDLTTYGNRFSEWLGRAKSDVSSVALLFELIDVAQLAEFEWAIEQGYFSEDCVFSEKDLQVLKDCEPANIVLHTHPSIKAFVFEKDIVKLLTADENSLNNELHKQADVQFDDSARKTSIVVFRDGWKMQWKVISQNACNILQWLQAGKTLGFLSQQTGYDESVVESWLQAGWIVRAEEVQP